jgi:hypothetical protein
MAFDTNLVAIRWFHGKYDVVSNITASINIEALRSKQQLVDVSTDASFSDYATIVSFGEFKNYLLPESVSWGSAARDWYTSLPDDIKFIVIHEAEWESGLG